MLQSAIGQFTVVDPQGTAKYFWKADLIADVLSASLINTQGVKRFALRVVSPEKVIPALTLEQILERQTVYAELQATGVVINLTRGRDHV